MEIFDRTLLKKRKNSAFKKTNESDFIKKEITLRLLERLDEIKQSFPLALSIGAELGDVAEILQESNKVDKLIQTDFAIEALKKNKYPYKINLDEENLSFKSNTFNLVIAPFSLHYCNNLHAVMENIYRILKPNGLFMGSFPIIGTLDNLEEALYKTELSLYKGVSNRVHPFSDIKILGNLLQQSKFAEIVADSDAITIMYKEFKNILVDLKTWGNSNILIKRNPKILRTDFFQKLEENFTQFKDPTTNHYPIKIEVCNLMAWKI